MKIGIDISQIVYEGTGVARFTNGLVNAILEYDKKNNWTFFFSSFRRDLDSQIENNIIRNGYKLIKWKLPPAFLSLLWNDLHKVSGLLTSNILHLTSLDWFITSDWTEPPLSVKKTTIVHDLVYLRYPKTVEQKILTIQQKRLALIKRESRIIFADSQATKNDLIKLLDIDSSKIYVNYPGVEIKKPTTQNIKQTLIKYNLTKPFILTVGKLEPRKNIKRLIETFNRLDNENIELVILGTQGWGSTMKQFNNLTINNPRIRSLGYVNDEALYSLYSACLFFIYPSIWEGFGYPIVEAMRFGAAVTNSNTSSLKEIANNATLLFDPFNLDEMYRCIDTLIHDKKLREDLKKKGLERSKMYTWEKYYNLLIKTLTIN